jgi:hypothetical protein
MQLKNIFTFSLLIFRSFLWCQNTPKDTISNFKTLYNSDRETWCIFPIKKTQNIDYQYLLEYSEMKDYGIALEKFAFTPQFSFKDSLEIKAPVRLKIAAFKNGLQYAKEIYFELKKHQGLGLPIQINQNENWAATALLSDGVLGTLQSEAAVWQAFTGKKSSIYLDFQEKMQAQNISMSFLTDVKKGISLPKAVEYYTSDDGDNWDFAWINSFENTAIPQNPAIFKSVWELPKEASFRHLMVVLVGFSTKKEERYLLDELLVK